MAKESFMLVSLKGDKAKKLAQVMANPTCTKILEYLAGKDATESQIAKDMGIPLSTVHYNLQQLVEAKLVIIDEFHYSEKGREVNHYKLANKYIIIAPQEEDPSFLANLRKYVPVAVIIAGFGIAIKFMQFFTGTAAATNDAAAYMVPAAAPMAKIAADTAAESGGVAGIAAATVANESADTAAFMVQEAAPEATRMMVEQGAQQTANQTVQTPWWQSPLIDYFLAGAVFVLLVIIITEAISYWRSKR